MPVLPSETSRNPSRRRGLTISAAALVVTVALLTGGGLAGATPVAAKPCQQLYVSLGDSYATGYQPTARGEGSETRNGYAYQLPALAKAKGYDLRLVNFGCTGATSASVVTDKGCHDLGPGGRPYPGRTQAGAAVAYIAAHRSRVAAITISIGVNDVLPCVFDTDPVSCVNTAVAAIDANLGPLVQRVRAAAGPKTPIIGTTYPDVALYGFLLPLPIAEKLARLSVTTFRDVINPALAAEYGSGAGVLVDVTRATGAYGSLDATTRLPPYGTIPVPVAKVCRLTFICRSTDIHPTTAGYRLIAVLITKALPRRTR